MIFLLFSFFVSDHGPGGSHLVEILVKSKGWAENDQQLKFAYVIAATAVTPASGSMAGGQTITISGSGFGKRNENVNVALGGSPCDIISISLFHITCITTAHAEGNVSIEISVGESSVTILDAFEYDSSLTISVTALSPQQGSVSGGVVITISGSGFIDTTMVQVGNENCKKQSVTELEITCVTARHAPGKYPIRVVTPGKGFAEIPERYSKFEYVLVVNSIYPLIGSVAGGTHVVISGQGFGSNASGAVVTVQDRLCAITSINDTHVICETEDIFQMKAIDNGGSHPG